MEEIDEAFLDDQDDLEEIDLALEDLKLPEDPDLDDTEEDE